MKQRGYIFKSSHQFLSKGLSFKGLLFMGVMMAAGGCASITTQLPEISLPELEAEQTAQEVTAFAEIERLHRRLSDVAFPILAANAELCPKTRRDIGITTHTLKSYSKDMRSAAARELGAQDKPSLRRVMKGSPAQAAGLKIGDRLIGKEGKALAAGDEELLDLFKDETAMLTIERGGQTLELTVRPVEMCDYKVKLSMRSTINAYATGKSLVMTAGMMNFTQNDEELALITAHELAHNTMKHVRKIVSNMILSGFATRYTRPFESEADYVGLYYMTRAGYSPDNAHSFWQRMARIGPRSVSRAKTHPTFPDRYLRLSAAREEILQKQAQGAPLIPNFISGGSEAEQKGTGE